MHRRRDAEFRMKHVQARREPPFVQFIECAVAYLPAHLNAPRHAPGLANSEINARKMFTEYPDRRNDSYGTIFTIFPICFL